MTDFFGHEQRAKITRRWKIGMAVVVILGVVLVGVALGFHWSGRASLTLASATAGLYGGLILAFPLMRTAEAIQSLARPVMNPVSSTGGGETYVPNPELIRSMAQDRTCGGTGGLFLAVGGTIQVMAEFLP